MRVVEKMGMDDDEGFGGTLEFLLWVSRNQALSSSDLVVVVVGGGGGSERVGFGEMSGCDLRCCFGGGEKGWSWVQKPWDWRERGRNRWPPLKKSPKLSSRTQNPYLVQY